MPPEQADTWVLQRGGTPIARLKVTGSDFPWVEARLEPLPGFGEVRALFDREWELSQAADDDEQAEADWEAVYEEVRSTVSLAMPDGTRVGEFLLHIDGDEAWWRWQLEPFGQN